MQLECRQQESIFLAMVGFLKIATLQSLLIVEIMIELTPIEISNLLLDLKDQLAAVMSAHIVFPEVDDVVCWLFF